MKRSIMLVLSLLFFGLMFAVAVVASPALAEGDKVRGDDAEGPASQWGICPFTG